MPFFAAYSVTCSSHSSYQYGLIDGALTNISFTPFSLSLVMPTYFQAIGKNAQSIFISVLRQIILLVPLAWIFSKFGLQYVWLTFPITEFIDALASYLLYLKYGRANIKTQGLTN